MAAAPDASTDASTDAGAAAGTGPDGTTGGPPGAVAPVAGTAAVDLRWLGLAGLVATTAVVAGAVAGGDAFVSHQGHSWFFGVPGAPLGSLSHGGRQPPVSAVLCVYGGLLLLTVAWLRLLRVTAARPGIPVRRVVGVLAVWMVPLLLAPPLFSRDVYSYAGQGEMVSHQVNPYHYGTGVLGATDFSRLAGSLWANTPSPYGPSFLALDGALTDLSGHHVLADLALLRLVELGGLALVAAGLPTLARSAGRDPAGAVALGVGSPLALATLLGGAHNDALMIGLLVAGLAVGIRAGPVPGIVLCALAAGVKAPAILGVVFIGWNWPGAGARARARVVATLGSLGLAAGTLAALSWISGVGWGWLRALGAPTKVSTGVTPVDALAKAVAGIAHLVGLQLAPGTARSAVGAVGLAAAAAIGAWLLWRSPRIGAVKALGLSLLALALLSPILWAWYLAWGLVVLAPVASGTLRRVVVAAAVAEAFVGLASVTRMVETVAHWGAVSDLVLLVGAAVMVLACLAARRLPPTGSGAGWAGVRDAYLGPASPGASSPWSRHRALQPVGLTVTASQRPQAGQ